MPENLVLRITVYVLTYARPPWQWAMPGMPFAGKPLAAPDPPCPTPAPAPTDGGVHIPDPPPCAPPGLAGKVDTLLGWGKWAVLVCGVAGLFICAGQMAIGRKNRSTFAADGATGIPWVLGGLSLAATAASIVGVFFQ